MGHMSVVYGNIMGAAWKTEDHHRLHRLNNEILNSLSDTDTYPWITKNMFNCPDPHNIRMYREQVITFGASYKEIEYEWSEWLEKFEAILKKLYWTSTTIHLNTELVGTHTYEWLFNFDQMDNWFLDNPQPINSWNFEGGPRKFF